MEEKKEEKKPEIKEIKTDDLKKSNMTDNTPRMRQIIIETDGDKIHVLKMEVSRLEMRSILELLLTEMFSKK